MSETPEKRSWLRRLTLAEGVGLAAVVIAGLSYWDGHHARVVAAREHAAEIQAGALKDTFLMTATPNGDGGALRMASAHPEQVIQTQTLWFPSAIRADSIETTGNPRLEAGWIEAGLNKAAGKARHGRAPVGIVTIYIEDGQTKVDRAVYQVGYSLHPRWLRADRVELEGLSLARRGVAGDLRGVVNGLWGRS